MPYLDLGTQGIAAELEPNLVIALKHEWEVLRGPNTHRQPLRSCLAPATAPLVIFQTLGTEGKDPLSNGIIAGWFEPQTTFPVAPNSCVFKPDLGGVFFAQRHQRTKNEEGKVGVRPQ